MFLAIPALVAAPAGAVRDGLLTELVEGRRTAAFAVADRAGAPEAVTVIADGHSLNGTVERVVDAGAADDLLVAARGADGVYLYAVDVAGPGVRRTSLVTLDLTRPQATVALSDAPGRLVAGPGEAERIIEHALQVGSALLAAEQVGAGQHLLDLSVEYAKSRLQFGRPIGSFQAVKHRLADLLVDLEHARSTAYHAVWALSDGSDDPALAVSIAQATCSAAFPGSRPTRSRCTAASGSRGNTRRTCTSSGPPPMPRCSAVPSSTGRGLRSWCSTPPRHPQPVPRVADGSPA